ncbi:ABC transporter permease [Fluoribacter dumoffii]|uniref:Glutathione transport system permease protein gsiD n=1 Tax=Fluoribacter dumoffii TaxID=463 RepID=A0A377GAG2_9GAMM|nr:ABC transporter permease [Fluoribacter dumoffii]KTC88710.1 ABC transporter permease [Fluoribacter dumoffii NY 23]MCW8385997.1 ABC transporter permease [Fluoribacter dumoffii]MCW8495708.1 ABC transporter permease [Fluoribacter dumoffii]STO21802.1 Glutathione transport system permease protein gsiD [Fluoribacter dumoffii]
MTVEFLWTDTCFLTLLALSVLIILLGLRKQHIRHSFNQILQRPIAVSAGIILLFFITIGVLDSIHLTLVKNETQKSPTLLDRILAPIDEISEKTYSAPLALRQFISETALVNGVVTQTYPVLIYPGKSIKTEAEKNKLIKNTIWYALACCLSAAIVIGIFFVFIRFARRLNSFFAISSTQWSALITLTLLTFFIVLGYELSRTFHVLGTGQIGQDIFYFTIKSIRTGLVIGLLTTLFMLPLALFLGVIAGYFGGIADDIIQYSYTTLSSIPGVLLITASVLSLQIYISNHPEKFTTLAQSADARLLALCFILGVTSWTNLCRLLRAETLKLREVDYVQAARALGSNWFTIIRKHLLPNVMHIVVITLVLDFSFLVMAEALLSYVGVGVSPMTISWGNMINSARLELARNPVIWWPMLAAFVFMFLLVLAINLFADAVRDAFDPHQSQV